MRYVDLKVNNQFYSNFSKYLNQISLKHLGGLEGKRISRVVLNKIERFPLTNKNIDVCLTLNNMYITEAVFRNTNPQTSIKYRYLYLIRKKLFKYSIINSFRYTINSSYKNTQKFDYYLLNHINKSFLLNKEIDIRIIKMLTSKYKCKCLCEVVEYAVIKGIFFDRNWRNESYWDIYFKLINEEKKLKWIEYLLRKDIESKEYLRINRIIKVSIKNQGSLISNKNIKWILQKIEEIIPFIFVNDADSVPYLISNLIKCIQHKYINIEKSIKIIKKINYSSEVHTTEIHFLISLIKKGIYVL